MSSRFGITPSATGLRPATAAVLVTVGVAMGSLGTMAAMGQAGVARASGPGPLTTAAAPGVAAVPPSTTGGFDGIDHSVPPAGAVEGSARDPGGEPAPTF